MTSRMIFYIENLLTCHCQLFHGQSQINIKNNVVLCRLQLEGTRKKTVITLDFFFLLILRIDIKLLQLSFIAFFSLSLTSRSLFRINRWKNALVSFLVSLFYFFLLPRFSLDNDRCHAMTPVDGEVCVRTTSTIRIQDASKEEEKSTTMTMLMMIDRYQREAMLFFALATTSSRH